MHFPLKKEDKDILKQKDNEPKQPTDIKKPRAASKKQEKEEKTVPIVNDKKRQAEVRKYVSFRNFHKLKGITGPDISNKASTQELVIENQKMEEMLSSQDQMKVAKVFWIMTTKDQNQFTKMYHF